MSFIKGFARIAAVSPPVHLGDVQNNEQGILAHMKALEAQGVQLAVFPELCLTGYTLGDLVLQPLLQQKAREALLRIAGASGGMAAVVGLPLSVEGQLYNCAAVVQGGALLGLVPKTYLAEGGEFYEARWFSTGEKAPSYTTLSGGTGSRVPFSAALLFDAGAFTFAVELCQDLWAPVPPSSYQAMAGADVIVNLSASNALVGKQEYRCQLLSQQSARLYAGYAYAGAGYGESTSDMVFDGYTGVYENGRPLAEGKRFLRKGSQAIADVDISRLRYLRQKSRSFFQGSLGSLERAGLAKPLPALKAPLLRPINPLPFVPQGPDGLAHLEEIVQIQSMGLATRLEAIRCRDVVIGVSGGLDSTLALLVAVHTFDGLGYPRSGIHAITMPGLGTGKRTKNNADILMEALQVTRQEISIEKAVQQHFQDIGQNPATLDVTYENSQARERTQILMDYANRVGGLVLGTGDMSELALGFCTYNGDHMSMYGLNGSVPKTLVRALVRHMAETEFDPQVQAVCADIVDTPISPELLPAKEGELRQRTEDILGDYALHDFFLYHMLSGGASPEALRLLAEQAFAGTYSPETIAAQLDTFLGRFTSQQFKRSCMPDGPKVGSVSLSPRGDLRMPSDMGRALWQE